MKTYQITCNKNQISLIAEAVEQYSRMICGQLDESKLPSISFALHKEHYEKFKTEHPDQADVAMTNFCRVRESVEYYLTHIKKLIWGLDKHGGYGIKYHPESDLGYEIYKQILSQFEREREEESIKNNKVYSSNVHTGDPLKLTNEPRIIVKLLNEELDVYDKIEQAITSNTQLTLTPDQLKLLQQPKLQTVKRDY